MNLKNPTWQQVALILGSVAMLLGTVIVLTLNHQDVSGVLQFGGLLLGGLGIGAVVAGQTAIKEQVNGRMSTLLKMFETLMHRLAEAPAMPPREIPATDPPEGSAGHI